MTKIRQRLGFFLGPTLLQKRPDDKFIVSYPRSGSTWLRTILVNVLRPDAESNPDVFNVVIPGLSWRNVHQINRMPSPRILKSHTWYRSEIAPTVYLVRDGRDVLVSLYHYMITRQRKTESFDKFFASYYLGKHGQRWHENVVSWLGEGREKLGDRLMVVKFEALKAETVAVVADILRFLQISASPTLLSTAIDKAQLDKVRSIERSRRGNMHNPDTSFYRGGQTGQWQDYLTPTMEEQFCNMSKQALQLGGYKHLSPF